MDIVALAATLRLEYNVSVLGYCYGGSLAWLAMQKSFIFEKGICYYGSSIPEFLESNVNCPGMLHFGSDDKGIPIESIEKVKKFINMNKIKLNYLYMKMPTMVSIATKGNLITKLQLKKLLKDNKIFKGFKMRFITKLLLTVFFNFIVLKIYSIDMPKDLIVKIIKESETKMIRNQKT